MLVGESLTESLIHFAEEQESDLIVVGGARDDLRWSRHRPGVGCAAAPFLDPGGARAAGYAEDPPRQGHRGDGCRANAPGDDNPLPFAITLASAAGPAHPHAVAGVGGESRRSRDPALTRSRMQIAAAEENLFRRRPRTTRVPRDRVPGRRGHDPGVGAEKAELG